MNVLVAGGDGFVGKHLVRRLLDRGHRVTVLDDHSTSSPETQYSHQRLRVIEGDVTDSTVIGLDVGPLGPFDVVVHLASAASPVDYARMPIETLNANSVGTFNLLRLCVMDKARFVYASTSEVYGDPLKHPQMESYWGNVNPVGPRSMYDEGKRFGEALATAFRNDRGVSAAILRIFNTYGPGMRIDDGRVMTAFIGAALAGLPIPVHGDGSQTRSFQYVSDLVTAFVLVIEDRDSDGLVANVGNPEEVTIDRLARLVLVATGSAAGIVRVEPRPEDPYRRCPDVSRFQSLYEWSPSVGLDEGLARTINHFAPRRWPLATRA